MPDDMTAGPARNPTAVPADAGPAPTPLTESPFVAELRRLERLKGTGVLRLGEDGAVHLADGAVAFAESRRTAGLGHLLAGATPPGTGEPWPPHDEPDIDLSDVPGPDRRPSYAADRSSLRVRTLLAVFDAAYFLLDSAARPEFSGGPPHRLARVCRISPAVLLRECGRRRAELEREWPSVLADRAPVVPVRRVDRQRVFLTGLQAEILLNADGCRTTADLARDLGRTTFGCLLAVRTLRAASLVEPPQAEPATRPAPRSERAALPVRSRRQAYSPEPNVHADEEAGRPPGRWAPVDRDVLIRLRTALERLA